MQKSWRWLEQILQKNVCFSFWNINVHKFVKFSSNGRPDYMVLNLVRYHPLTVISLTPNFDPRQVQACIVMQRRCCDFKNWHPVTMIFNLNCWTMIFTASTKYSNNIHMQFQLWSLLSAVCSNYLISTKCLACVCHHTYTLSAYTVRSRPWNHEYP